MYKNDMNNFEYNKIVNEYIKNKENSKNNDKKVDKLFKDEINNEFTEIPNNLFDINKLHYKNKRDFN